MKPKKQNFATNCINKKFDDFSQQQNNEDLLYKFKFLKNKNNSNENK